MITITDSLGETRFLGNLPGALTRSWRIFGDAPRVDSQTPPAPLLPRSMWKPTSLRRFVPAIKDQNGVGACNAFSTVNLVEGCRAMAGLPSVTLSPGYLYGNINGQRDQGSLLEDALEWMLQNGTCRASVVPDLAWRRSQWPAEAPDDARNYRVLEAFLCPTFDHLASAVQAGFLLSLGVMWCDADRPDGDGWLPTSVRGQAGGHAICGYSLEKRGNAWGLGFVNSWTERWGRRGCAVLAESRFQGPVGGWWAVRSTVTEPGDLPPLQ